MEGTAREEEGIKVEGRREVTASEEEGIKEGKNGE
jgi:hypothetical protein